MKNIIGGIAVLVLLALGLYGMWLGAGKDGGPP